MWFFLCLLGCVIICIYRAVAWPVAGGKDEGRVTLLWSLSVYFFTGGGPWYGSVKYWMCAFINIISVY
jgi:hypothetical protein